jgi:hypothetical protein
MAIVTGGILGRVKGKTGGIVFSSARSRGGKVNTVREFVNPSNPQTPDQQAQRGLFKRALVIVKGFGPDQYAVDFNRAVQQLPGFQAMMSILLHNNDGAGLFTAPGDTPLGDLYYPATVTAVAGPGLGEITLTWSTELGSNGTANDIVKAACYAVSPETAVQYLSVLSGVVRSDGAVGIGLSPLTVSTVYVWFIWFVGAGTSEGLISKAHWDTEEASGPA